MFISKHHYASELAKLGNTVYFMNAPEKGVTLRKGEVRIEQTDIDNLFIVKHKLFYPYILKFKALFIHNFLLKFHIRKIYNAIAKPVDIVWSFDVSDTIHLCSFPENCLKIFMPVDNPVHPKQKKCANVMFSVTQEILDMYHCNTPKMFVNHGVADYFINDEITTRDGIPVHVGISGNFLRPDIDWECLLQIITAHNDVIFNFWGAFEIKDGNLSANINPDAIIYKTKLAGLRNVILHGVVDVHVLANELKKMDAFLICYDIDKDQSNGTNYHKVLEYLASGKVVVSNNITTYRDTGLVEMPLERNNNILPALFTDVIKHLDVYNSADKQEDRIAYAKAHTYKNNIMAIESFISQQVAATDTQSV